MRSPHPKQLILGRGKSWGIELAGHELLHALSGKNLSQLKAAKQLARQLGISAHYKLCNGCGE